MSLSQICICLLLYSNNELVVQVTGFCSDSRGEKY